MMMKTRLVWLLALLPVAGSVQAQTATDTPPTARTVDVVDHDFGLTLPDPYRWMEGENNAEFDTWLKAQGAASRSKLDALPTLEAWRERLGKAASAGISHFYHALAGDRLFFLRETAGKEGVLMLRECQHAGAGICRSLCLSRCPTRSAGRQAVKPSPLSFSLLLAASPVFALSAYRGAIDRSEGVGGVVEGGGEMNTHALLTFLRVQSIRTGDR